MEFSWKFVLFFLHMVLFAATSEDGASPPHVVFMMVDDWGWANVGYHRNPPTKEVDTPNFDNLKQKGLELDQH